MRTLIHLVLLCALLGTSGCAWTAQRVNLNPAVAVPASRIGKGRPVFVEVKDERPSEILGYKVPAGGGEIKPSQDPALVGRGALVGGLTQLGFQPAAQASAATPALAVELRAIDYKVTQGFWSGGLYVDVAMKALCKIGDTIKYDALYRGHHEENIQVAQSQAENEEYINDALSQAINGALRDERLLQCLAGGDASGSS
jgi:uncharacterized lipoprotein YajG